MYDDSHLHTAFSGDSETPPAAQIEQAIRLGMKTLCITDHQDFDYPPCESEFLFDTASYFEKLSALKDYYSAQIDLRIGVELGLQPKPLSVDLPSYAAAWPFDFIIGSTHVVQHQDPAFPSYYEGISTEEGYRAYFNEILTSIRSFTNFDIYGHIDYVIRYSKTKDLNYCYGQYADIFDPIIETLIANGKGIEINTAGLDKGLKEQHPCTEFIRQYRKKGGEIITVGSDAHRPEDIGRHFDHAADVLKECGFSYYCTFEKRVPAFHKL